MITQCSYSLAWLGFRCAHHVLVQRFINVSKRAQLPSSRAAWLSRGKAHWQGTSSFPELRAMCVQYNNVGCFNNILIPVGDRISLTRESRPLNPEALKGPFRTWWVAFPCAPVVLAGSKLGERQWLSCRSRARKDECAWGCWARGILSCAVHSFGSLVAQPLLSRIQCLLRASQKAEKERKKKKKHTCHHVGEAPKAPEDWFPERMSRSTNYPPAQGCLMPWKGTCPKG